MISLHSVAIIPDTTAPWWRACENYYTGFGRLLHCAALILLTSDVVAAQVGSLTEMPFPYEVQDLTIAQAIDDFTRRTGTPVAMTGVAGRISVANAEGSAAAFLDAAAAQVAAAWWQDGVTVHLEPRAGMRRQVLPSRGVPLADLVAALDFAGLDVSRHPVDATPDGRFFRLSGPGGWVDAAAAIAGGLVTPAATDVPPDAAPPMPRVYRGMPARRGGGATRPITAPGPAPAPPGSGDE